jgi:polynucleotide 5'-hydroxyl-kinase GRC3/NOL9
LDNALNKSFRFRSGLHPFGKAVRLEIRQGHTILLTGPAQIKLSNGRADCFGAPIKSNSWIQVEELRQEPILAVDACTVEIKLGHRGSWKLVNESTIPTGWSEAAQVVERQGGITVIVGDVDSGKSSLCTFLANVSVHTGLRVGLVDADVGQADIGPPTTVSSANLSQPILSLQEVQPETAFFVGDTSPSSVPVKLIQSLVRLKDDLTRSSDVVILNTDGWVGDSAALRFKEELVHETEADLVLGLSRAEEIDPLLSILSSASLKLSSSNYARTRSKEERKGAREAGYRRFLGSSKIMKIRQDDTTLRMFDHPEQSILRWDRSFKGFLGGLLDSQERLLGIGRIREMSDGHALVETQTSERPRFLEIGNILLSSNYEETGYGTLH